MNPNPEQIQKIKSFVANMDGGWNNTTTQIREAMASPTEDNPTPQAQVPPVYAAKDLYQSGQLSGESVAKLVMLPSFHAAVVPLINTNPKSAADIANLNTWAATYMSAGIIQQAEYAFLTGKFNQVVPDPDYQAKIGWDLANLGRQVDDFDIEIARHN